MKSNTINYALVTGASAGIGRAIAIELAKRNINVLLVALPDTGLPEFSRQLSQSYMIRSEYLEMDLTQPMAPKRLHRWCRYNNYKVNILINNAGFGNLQAFYDTESDFLQKMMILNNQSLVMLTHHFIPDLKSNGNAYILNVGSLASFLPLPNKSVYAATKSFVYAFSSSLRLELFRDHISVCCLCPGGTRTNKGNLDRLKKVGTLGNIFSQSAEEVAADAVTGMLNKRHRIIPGLHNRVLYVISKLIPESITFWIVQRLFNKRGEKQEQPVEPVPSTAMLGLMFK